MTVTLSFDVDGRSPSEIAQIFIEALGGLDDFEINEVTLTCDAYTMLHFPNSFPTEMNRGSMEEGGQ